MQIDTLTETESTALLDHLSNPSNTQGNLNRALRNRLLCLVMLDAGLRVGEAVQLKIADVWFNGRPTNSVQVRAETSKSHSARLIPMTERLRLSLLPFYGHDSFPSHLLTTANVFLGKTGFHHMATRHAHRIITRAGLASIGREVHPHVLRHTFASRLMRQTNARIVQELLGHKNLHSTQIYTHPNSDDLVQAIKAI